MRMFAVYSLIMFILFLICLQLCAKEVKVRTFAADPTSQIILVAVMQDTDTAFKNALIDSLKANFQPDFTVKKVVIKKAKELKGEKYRLLIVMDQLKAWLMLNGQTKAIQSATNYDHTIFLMTSGDPKWQWKTKDIHHIASASDKPKLGKVWAELKTKVDTLLK